MCQEICDTFWGPLFLIMCLANIKNICDIYYPKNWENLHIKKNYILLENGPTREIFQSTSEEQLFSNSMVFFLALVSMEYLIYLKMLPKKNFYLVVKSEEKNK